VVAAAVVVLVSLASGIQHAHQVRHDWSPDSVLYLRMALEDRGFSRADALAEADRYVLASGAPELAKIRFYYTGHPPAFYARQYNLFRNRPLFPWLASWLYPAYGAQSLQIVSAAACILAAWAMFALLLLFVAPALAALGAIGLARAAPLLAVQGFGTTDGLAVLFWIVAFALSLLYLRRGGRAVLAGVVAAALALAFTRPAVYLLVGAALGALVAMRADPPARGRALRLLAAAGVAAAAFVVSSVVVRGATLHGQLHWIYGWQRDVGATHRSFTSWYLHAVPDAVRVGLREDLHYHYRFLFLAFVLAPLGLLAVRRTPLFGVAIGALLAAPVALLLNPSDLVRTVELPMLPIVVLLATIAVAEIVRRGLEARGIRDVRL
jgi:hypothetical protein